MNQAVISTIACPQNLYQRLTLTYIVALSLIACLTLASQYVIRSALGVQSDDSRVINIAGRQRMLSQRIAKLALLLDRATNPMVFQRQKALFADSVRLWEQSHNGLLHGDAELGLPGTNSPLVLEMFDKLHPHYRAIQQATQQLLTLKEAPVPPHLLETLLHHEPEFLEWMNTITFQYDAEARARVEELKWVELVLMNVTLLVLLLEALLVFRPAVTMIKRQIEALKTSEQEKRHVQDNLIAQLKTNERLQFQINQDLEVRVVERTAEITKQNRYILRQSEQLRTAKHQAETANITKSQFIMNMSHELRTPLNAIIGYAEILHEEIMVLNKPELQEDVNNVREAARHLLSLIDDVLDLSKIEAGRIIFHFEVFDLRALLEELNTTIAPSLKKNRNTLNIDIQDSVPTPSIMRTDITRLRQILLNLLSNATKFTEDGSINLMVKHSRLHKQNWFQFHVSDTGIGMTPEQQDKIFMPFMQVDASTTRKYGGTGLGLAIAKSFVELMGGRIIVNSIYGHGTTFSIYLPVNVEAHLQRYKVLEE